MHVRLSWALPVDGRPDDDPDPYAAGRELTLMIVDIHGRYGNRKCPR